MIGRRAFVALLVASTCGWAMLRHSKRMLFEGITLEEGGGWTAVVTAEFMIALGAIAVALY